MTEIKGNVLCKSSTTEIIEVEANGKTSKLELTDAVKKYNPKGLEAGVEYYIMYNDETNMCLYAKKKAVTATKSNLKSYDSKPEVKKPEIKKVKSEVKLKESVFSTLNSIECNISKKGRYNYVSWTEAWSEVKSIYPESTFKVYENTEGFPAFIMDDIGAFVKVGVTIAGIEHIENYPVLDFNNKAIIGIKLNVFDINKAIKRCMTKALAFHGLGLYIYAGEDLPEESKK